jgi:hypothetical protein
LGEPGRLATTTLKCPLCGVNAASGLSPALLEGIVAKRRDRPYRSGRSADWIKMKNPDAPAATSLIEG